MLEDIINYGAFFCGLVTLGGLFFALLWEAVTDLIRERRGKRREGGR